MIFTFLQVSDDLYNNYMDNEFYDRKEIIVNREVMEMFNCGISAEKVDLAIVNSCSTTSLPASASYVDALNGLVLLWNMELEELCKILDGLNILSYDDFEESQYPTYYDFLEENLENYNFMVGRV